MLKLAIFDLDGVIVSTDHFHYRAWKAMADQRGWDFDEELNHELRGVSRAECLAIILDANDASVTEADKEALLEMKNTSYRNMLSELSSEDILPGVAGLLAGLRSAGILLAIGSSSRNTPTILERIGMADGFDAVVDGNMISNSKPHPEVFLKGAHALGIAPSDCVVFEDAQAGVDAARAAGMMVVGVGPAALEGTDIMLSGLADTDAADIMAAVESA